MKRAAIIAAGGKGTRMNSAIPKQFLQLLNKPIIFHTIEAFYSFDHSIQLIVVLPEAQQSYWQNLLATHKFLIPHQVVSGGETRYHSVKNGLALAQDADVIAIHDAVRPLIHSQFLERLFAIAEEKGSAIPVLQTTDTIRQIKDNETMVLDRTTIYAVQTPQVFIKEWLLKAYTLPYKDHITDDAMLVEIAGFKLTFTEGLKTNIKITTSEDILLASCLLQNN